MQLQRNINNPGRAMRGLGSLLCIASAVLLWSHSRTAAALLGVVAVFMFFEAARGWCALRACGIKTPL